MTRFSSNSDAIAATQASAWQVHMDGVDMATAGHDVIFLSVGDPDFATPSTIIEAGRAALTAGRTHYAPIAGEAALRGAIAHRAEKRTGVPTAADTVNVYAGAQNAVFNVLQTIAGPGDTVLVPDPYYATYPIVIMASGATQRTIACRPDVGFKLQLADVVAATTGSTRVLLLNSPANPTGATFDANEMAAIVEHCRAHDLWLVCDEVYAGLSYDAPAVSARALVGHPDDKIVVIDSLSKSHAMTGWRLGWSIGPADLSARLTMLNQGSQFGAPQFIQDAALVAVSHDLPEVEAMAHAYRARRDAAVAALDAIPGISCRSPAGGMFLMLDVRAIEPDCRMFAQDLLAATGVVTLPGCGFGPSARGHVRITLAQPVERLLEAVARIAHYLGTRHENLSIIRRASAGLAL